MKNAKARYLTYMLIALVPQLHGCLWESLHVEGKLDAETAGSNAEDSSPKGGDISLLEDNSNESPEEK